MLALNDRNQLSGEHQQAIGVAEAGYSSRRGTILYEMLANLSKTD